jgi:hypothetical protein
VLSMVSALPIPVDVLVATAAVMPTTCGRPRGSGLPHADDDDDGADVDGEGDDGGNRSLASRSGSGRDGRGRALRAPLNSFGCCF